MSTIDGLIADAAGKMVKYFALHTMLTDAIEQTELAAIADIECKDDEHDEAITNLRELMKCALTILNDKGTLLELDLKPQDFMPFSKTNATLQLAATDFSIGDFDTCIEKLIELQGLIEDLKTLVTDKKASGGSREEEVGSVRGN